MPQVDSDGDGTHRRRPSVTRTRPARRPTLAQRPRAHARRHAARADADRDGARDWLPAPAVSRRCASTSRTAPPLPRPAGRSSFRRSQLRRPSGLAGGGGAPADGVAARRARRVPDRDVSRALRAYPEDMLQAPLRVSEAHMRLSAGGPVASSTAAPPAGVAQRRRALRRPLHRAAHRSGAARRLDHPHVAARRRDARAPSTRSRPGHGKTIVGAYLVGSRGTARHALLPRARGHADPHDRRLPARARHARGIGLGRAGAALSRGSAWSPDCWWSPSARRW